MSDIQGYAAPHTLDEAADILRAGNVTIFAGGTDVMPQMKAGKLTLQPTLMNIRHIPELRGISRAQGTVRIGALTTMTELLNSELVREWFIALWQACNHFASSQLRNTSTIGGNICNASPAGDTLVPLLVLDAKVVLTGKLNGALATRTLPLKDFFVAPGRTKREANELLIAVEMPLPPAGSVSEFFKFGTRPALDIAMISIGLGAMRVGKTLRNVRVAFGSVAPTPIRAPQTEAAIEGKPLDDATIEAAVAAAAKDIHPISDVRASDWYRRELVHNILQRMLVHVRDR